jgi:hypothetical protein
LKFGFPQRINTEKSQAAHLVELFKLKE